MNQQFVIFIQLQAQVTKTKVQSKEFHSNDNNNSVLIRFGCLIIYFGFLELIQLKICAYRLRHRFRSSYNIKGR